MELHVHFEGITNIDHACLDLLMNWEKQHAATGGSLMIDWESLTAKFRQPGNHNGKNGGQVVGTTINDVNDAAARPSETTASQA